MWVPSCEVLIVGAGPAGCAAAITGQRLGLNVVVVDKATFPRDKCCGDGLTTLALRELEQLGVHPTATRSWMEVSDIFLRSPRGKEIQLHLPKTRGQYAAVVERRAVRLAAAEVPGGRCPGGSGIRACSCDRGARGGPGRERRPG